MHADLGVDYFQARSLDAEEQLLNSTVKQYEQALELTESRFQGGIASEVEVEQAKTALQATVCGLVLSWAASPISTTVRFVHRTQWLMGLAQAIVESHGGRLWAADNPTRGARFCFTLPTSGETHDSVVSRDRGGPADGLRANNPVV